MAVSNINNSYHTGLYAVISSHCSKHAAYGNSATLWDYVKTDLKSNNIILAEAVNTAQYWPLQRLLATSGIMDS